MGKKRNCAVVGCLDQTSSRHRFPEPNRDKERYAKWIRLSGNSKLESMDPELVYRSYRICHRHFQKEDHASNMYLQKYAIPLLHLPTMIQQESTCSSEPSTLTEEGISTTGVRPQLPACEDAVSTQGMATSNDDEIVTTPKHCVVIERNESNYNPIWC